MSTTPSTSSLASPARRSRPSRGRKPRRIILPCCLVALSFASVPTATTALSSPQGDLPTRSFSNVTFLAACAAGNDPATTHRASHSVTTTAHQRSASAGAGSAVGAAWLNNEGTEGESSVTVITATETIAVGGSMVAASGTTTIGPAAISTSTAVPASYTIPRAFE